MSDSIKTIKYKGCTIEIYQDETGFIDGGPRDGDNLGIMACFHKRYCLGDDIKWHGMTSQMFDGWDKMESYIRTKRHGVIIFPLFLFDHSGLTISIDPTPFRQADSAGWDWGQVGFIYTTRERIMANFTDGRKKKNLTNKMLEHAAKILRSEIETYDLYLRDAVYGYQSLDEDGETIDQCTGFYGDDGIEYAIKEGKGGIDQYLENKKNGVLA